MGFLSGGRGGHNSRSSTRRRPSRLGGRSLIEQLESRWLLSASPVAGSTALVAGTQAAEEAAAGNSIDAFALDLYAQLQGTTGGNLFASPFSAASALAMAYAGAGGDTAQQMANVLHLSGDASATESELGALLGDLNTAGQSGGFVLNAANALWVQQGLNLLPEFLSVMQNDFDSGLNQADFASAAETARQTINNWVAQQTNNKITDLFPEGSLNDLTKLVLADAVYFKAPWSSPFEPGETTDAPFTLASGNQVTASTMHQTGQFGYMESGGFQVLQLPYADGRMAMDILLPTQTGLAGLGSNQLPSDLNTWLDGLSTQNVAISLPKFQMTTQFDLIPALKALGMTDAFTNDADFSGMTDDMRLEINNVLQKAFISVDEAGTEAAAATGISMVPACIVVDPNPPVVFNADHPFLFLIRDTQSGTVLFMGQVEDPTQQGSDSSAPVITQSPRSDEPVTQNPVTQNPVTQPPAVPPQISAPIASSGSTTDGAPTAVNHSYVLSESNSSSATAADGLLVGASDPNGDPLTAKLVTPPTNGTLVLNSDGSFTYTPGAAFSGSDSFTYEASDGSLDSGPETVSIVSFQGSIINKLYNETLHRDADPGGLHYWLGQVQHGVPYGTIAAGIFLSAEHLTPIIESYYQQFLLRPADASGLAYWQGVWQSAGGPEPVIAGMITSSEFFHESAVAHPALSQNAAWVTALYERLLNREPDGGGLRYWTSILDAGTMTPTQVVNGFQHSAENFQNLVTGFFNEYLNRAPSSSELANYVAQFEVGTTDEGIQIELINTGEYANTPPPPAPGDVRQLS